MELHDMCDRGEVDAAKALRGKRRKRESWDCEESGCEESFPSVRFRLSLSPSVSFGSWLMISAEPAIEKTRPRDPSGCDDAWTVGYEDPVSLCQD
jgi:hypothetical protein